MSAGAGLVLVEVVIVLAAVQRLAELVHSRRNLACLADGSPASDSDANWGVLVALQVLWLAGCALEPALRGTVAPLPALVAGLVLFGAGETLRLWCILALGRWWNARARVDPGLRVVHHGPYRLVRHPNYLGVLLELVGLCLAAGAWWTLTLLALPHLLVLRRRMRGEDALLFALPGYAETMGAKGALLPRLRTRAGEARPGEVR